MIVPVMAISNLVLTQQIYSEETNCAHAHYREPVPLTREDYWAHKVSGLILFSAVWRKSFQHNNNKTNNKINSNVLGKVGRWLIADALLRSKVLLRFVLKALLIQKLFHSAAAN